MATNQENYTSPVDVKVTNFPDTKKSIEDVRKEANRIYSLLNGKDYKELFKEFTTTQNKLNTRTQSIEKLLGDIKTSLGSIQLSSKSTTSQNTPVPSVNNYNVSSNDDEKKWRDSVEQSILAIEREVVGSSRNEDRIVNALEGIKELAKNNKIPKDMSKYLHSLLDETQKQQKEYIKYRKEDKDLSKSENKSLERALDEVKNAIEEGNDKTESEEESIKRAQGILEDIKSDTSHFGDALKRSFDSFKDLFTNGLREIFNKWDTQIATLKDQGMGGPNAAMLNKMTRRTMDATEQTLGWNVSIDKAIKATNAMIAAGQSPRYLRENNKQLITGLEGVGLNLQQGTIRAIGQSVFDSSQVKNLTQGWARIISKDTEGALDSSQVSSFLESDDFKKATAAMRMGGASYADIQKEIIKQTTEAVKAGITGQDALAMALTSAQNNLGRGAVVVVPERLSSYIGAAQIAGTYSGNVGNLTADFGAAIQAYHSNANVRQRIDEASASLAQSGDYSLLENIQFNDGHTRRLATMQDIEEGQYEGLIPRITKSIAGLLPAESLGSVSQQLTGDSGFLTRQGFDLVGGLLKDGPQIFYLRQIAKNTKESSEADRSLSGEPGAEKGGKLGKFFSQALPIIGGLAVTAGLMYTAFSDSKAEEKAAEEAQKRAYESYVHEMELEKQHREALLSGNKKLADDIHKQLQEARERTDQEIKGQAEHKENQSDDLWKMGGAGAGGVLGAALAVGAGLLAAPTGGLSLAAGLGLAGAGLAGGAALGYGGTALATGASGPNMSSEVSSSRSSFAQTYAVEQANKNKYKDGGIITEEQIATIGEGGSPELIIPLTNPERANELMSQAAQLEATNPEVASMLLQDSTINTVADNMVKGAQAQFGRKYSEMVCNQMVEAAMRWAGLTPPETGVVYKHFNSPKMHLVLNDPENGISPNDPRLRKGMILFSHPFTQEDVDKLNKSKGGRRKVGDPGHMGIYAGDGLWWNSTSSVNTTDYSSGKGINVSDDKGYGVALTKPFTTGTYKLFAAGYYDGMFDDADIMGLPSVSPDIPPISLPSLTKPYPSENISTSTLSKVDVRRIYNDSVKNADLKYRWLDGNVMSDILYAKSKDMSSDFDARIEANNPLGLLNIDGSMKQFDSVESGIQAFISKIEDAYDKLGVRGYTNQLNLLRNENLITGYDYDRAMSYHQDRLATSIDRLNTSVQESNRLAKSTRNPMNVAPISGRRYT